MKTLQELREAVANKSAKILTIDIANQLKGKRIATIYFGYHGQDGIDEFIVGDIISELDYNRNLQEDCFVNHPKGYKNRAEYWESYMTSDQLKKYRNQYLLLAVDGRNTWIRAHEENDGAFTCSDSDRFVYYIEIGNIETSKPEKNNKLDKIVSDGYFESKNGRKFYNLYASYDAKLNVETGEAWKITSPVYESISLPTINELLENGTLIDKNYGKSGNEN